MGGNQLIPSQEVTHADVRDAFGKAPPRSFVAGGDYQPSETENYGRYYELLIDTTLEGLEAPSWDFIKMASAKVGWDSSQWTECLDEWLAAAFNCPRKGETDESARKRMLAKIRKERERLQDWQGLEGNPILIDMERRTTEKATRPVYFYCALIGDLLNQIERDCPPGPINRDLEKNLKQRAQMRIAEYKQRFEGTARRRHKKRTNTPESDVDRAATLMSKAYTKIFAKGQSAQFGYDAAKREAIGMIGDALEEKFGNDEAVDLDIARDIFNRRWPSLNPEKQSELKQWMLSLIGADYPEMFSDAAPAVKEVREFNEEKPEAKAAAPAEPREPIGVPISEFIESHPDFAVRQAFREFQPSFDKDSPFIRHTAKDPCPVCDDKNCATTPDGKMTICRRCSDLSHKKAKNGAGCMHFHDEGSAYVAPAVKPRPNSAAPAQIYAAAGPLMSSAGAKYLNGRGVPTDKAITASVRYHNHPSIGRSVVFALRDQNSKIVAAQSRAISDLAGGLTRYNDGPTGGGVFSAPTGALEYDRIAICEAPIDALVLWSAGLPAIATCGDRNWPDWLTQALVGKDVVTSQDADKAGDEAALRVGERLQGSASVMRFRPAGGKDWAEIAERDGLEVVGRLIEAFDNRLGGAPRPAPSNYKELWNSLDEDGRYELEELAARIEDGDPGSRLAAESMAFLEWKKLNPVGDV
jgi:hypothetical protein